MLLSAHWVLVFLCGNGSRECMGRESGSLHSACCLGSDRVWRPPRTGLPAAGSPGPWPVPIWSLGHGGCGDGVIRSASAVLRAQASHGWAAQPPLLRAPTCSCHVGPWRSGGSGLPGSPYTAGDDPGCCAARITPDSRQWGWGKQPAPVGSAPPHVLLDFGGKVQEGGRWAQKEPQGEHGPLLLETCDSAQL